MRRSRFTLSITLAASLAACLAFFTPAATATSGPGGWNRLGTGATPNAPAINAKVSALHAVGPVLYAGGDFTNAGNNANADRIAKWNGTSWSALGAGLASGTVYAIAHYGNKIYAGGNFQDAGGNLDADNLAVFNGTSWAPFCDAPAHVGPAVNLGVTAIQVIGTKMYVGGGFQNATGDATADYLLVCDLITGLPSSTVNNDGDFTGGIYALAADSNGVLYAGGVFANLDGILAADRIASYDGTWHAVGNGVPGIVRALTTSGTNLYVGADQQDIGGLPKADRIAKWDSLAQTWSAMGSNTAGTDGWLPASASLNGMTTLGSLVFVTGNFSNANGSATADNVAYFDGTTWRPLGSNGAGNGPLNAVGYVAAVFLGQLYIGGNFTSAGGDPIAWFIASRSLRLPDGLITVNGVGPIVGNNIYNSTAVGQTSSTQIARGSNKLFIVYAQNDGTSAASFKLKGTGVAAGYTVSYFDVDNGNANITTAVRNGTFTTGSIGPGSLFRITMRVALSLGAANTGNFYVIVSSTAGTPVDVIRGTVNAI